MGLSINKKLLLTCPDLVPDTVYTCRECGLGHEVQFIKIRVNGQIFVAGVSLCETTATQNILSLDGKIVADCPEVMEEV